MNLSKRHRFGALLAVSILLGSGLYAPQTVAAQSVSASHPRVWLNAERLARLRDYKQRNTLRWQKLKSIADTIVNNSSFNGVDEIRILCLAYQTSGNTAYANKAVTLLTEKAVPTNTYQGDSYYEYRAAIPAIAAGFDWCYPVLTASQRQQIASWLMDRADAVWPETNPARIGGWGVDNPANNYFYGFLMTWPAALAAYGDDPRAPAHLKLALTKFTDRVRAYTDGWGRGGFFAESTNYDSTSNLARVLDAHFTATGEDLVNDPNFDYLRESIYWRIHSTVPKKDGYYILGDQSRVSAGPLSPYDRLRALVPLTLLKDPLTVSYGKHWLNTIKPSITDWWQLYDQEFLFFNEDVTATDYTTALPRSYFTEGSGVLLTRSDWSDAATYYGIWAGPLSESHQGHEANGFLIYKGGWLVGNATVWSYSGVLSGSIFHNVPTFGSYAQTWQEPDTKWPHEAGYVLRHESSADYTLFVGQAAQAYVQDRSHGGNKVVNDYVRKFLGVGDTFVVYDRINLVDSSLVKNWWLQSHNAVVINGRSFKFDNGVYALAGTSVLPTSATLQSIPVNEGIDGALSSYSLRIASTENVPTSYFLNVLQVMPLQGGALPVASVTVLSGAYDGVVVGSSVFLTGRSEAFAENVSYKTNISATANHLITDAAPNAGYTLSITDLATGQATSTTIKSSVQGVLRFSVPGGSRRVEVTLQSADQTAPRAPSGLTGYLTSTRAILHWSKNTEPDLAGYNVYLSSGGNTPFKINPDPVFANSFVAEQLSPGQSYSITIRALDTSNNESPPSDPLQTQSNNAVGAPAAPKNVRFR